MTNLHLFAYLDRSFWKFILKLTEKNNYLSRNVGLQFSKTKTMTGIGNIYFVTVTERNVKHSNRFNFTSLTNCLQFTFWFV